MQNYGHDTRTYKESTGKNIFCLDLIEFGLNHIQFDPQWSSNQNSRKKSDHVLRWKQLQKSSSVA